MTETFQQRASNNVEQVRTIMAELAYLHQTSGSITRRGDLMDELTGLGVEPSDIASEEAFYRWAKRRARMVLLCQ